MNHRNSEVPASEASTEAAIVAAGKTAPRITPADIDAQIVSEHYFTADEGVYGHDITLLRAANPGLHISLDPASDAAPVRPATPLATLTFCVLVLRNGFTVTGESACVSPDNFDIQIGRDTARRNARDKIWSLEGYQLKTHLHKQANAAE